MTSNTLLASTLTFNKIGVGVLPTGCGTGFGLTLTEMIFDSLRTSPILSLTLPPQAESIKTAMSDARLYIEKLLWMCIDAIASMKSVYKGAHYKADSIRTAANNQR